MCLHLLRRRVYSRYFHVHSHGNSALSSACRLLFRTLRIFQDPWLHEGGRRGYRTREPPSCVHEYTTDNCGTPIDDCRCQQSRGSSALYSCFHLPGSPLPYSCQRHESAPRSRLSAAHPLRTRSGWILSCGLS